MLPVGRFAGSLIWPDFCKIIPLKSRQPPPIPFSWRKKDNPSREKNHYWCRCIKEPSFPLKILRSCWLMIFSSAGQWPRLNGGGKGILWKLISRNFLLIMQWLFPLPSVFCNWTFCLFRRNTTVALLLSRLTNAIIDSFLPHRVGGQIGKVTKGIDMSK